MLARHSSSAGDLSNTDNAATIAAMTTTSTDIAQTAQTDTAATTATSTSGTDLTATSGMTATTTSGTTSTSAMTSSPPVAITIDNRCAKEAIAVAICYLNTANQWLSTGWWRVEPQKTLLCNIA